MDTSSPQSDSPQRTMLKVFALLVVCLAVGILFYYTVEGFSLIDSIYFTSMTLTTVGYGDFTPKTDGGKLFTAVYAFVGIGVFLGFAAALFQVALSKMHRTPKD